MNAKVYVDVNVDFDTDGNMRPRELIWEDGKKFQIDRVLDVRPAASLKAGGQGDRFTIIVLNKQSYLWFERCAAITGCQLGRWFVERRYA